ncbi:hypothetical protein HK097_010333, partial [Rhizophlyctis rosea]
MPRISDSQLKEAVYMSTNPTASVRVKSANTKRPPVSRVFTNNGTTNPPVSRSPSTTSSTVRSTSKVRSTSSVRSPSTVRSPSVTRSESPAPRVHVTPATAAAAAGGPRNARRENEWARQNLDQPAPIPIPYIRKARSIGDYAPSEISDNASVGSLESIEVSHASVMPSSLKSNETASQKARRSGSVVSAGSSVGSSVKPKTTPKIRATPTEITTVEMCRSCLEARSNDPIAIELQANDRALRKIMDLEISNTSLLAVNTSLETTIRKQSQLIEQMRHEIAKFKGLEIDENDTVLSEFVDPVLLEEKPASAPTVDVDGESRLSDLSDPETEATDSTRIIISPEDEQAQKEAQLLYARVCAVIEQLTVDGRKAVQYRAPKQEVDSAYVDDFKKIEVSSATLPATRAFATLGRSAGVLRRNSSFPAPNPPAKADKIKRRSAGAVPQPDTTDRSNPL